MFEKILDKRHLIKIKIKCLNFDYFRNKILIYKDEEHGESFKMDSKFQQQICKRRW